MSRISDNIKRARLLKGITQEFLSMVLGVTQATISQYEKGARTPTYEMLQAISDTLDVTIEELTGNNFGEVGTTQLIRKIKGLSPSALDYLSKYADFLKGEVSVKKGV